MSLLNNLWSYALPKAKAEAAELQQLMDKEGKGEKLEAWDWWYYTEKLRKEKYNLSEEDTKPYFKLENVREGAFAVANKLYGITLNKLEGIPTYHPDVEVFEVKDADGSQLSHGRYARGGCQDAGSENTGCGACERCAGFRPAVGQGYDE